MNQNYLSKPILNGEMDPMDVTLVSYVAVCLALHAQGALRCLKRLGKLRSYPKPGKLRSDENSNQ